MTITFFASRHTTFYHFVNIVSQDVHLIFQLTGKCSSLQIFFQHIFKYSPSWLDPYFLPILFLLLLICMSFLYLFFPFLYHRNSSLHHLFIHFVSRYFTFRWTCVLCLFKTCRSNNKLPVGNSSRTNSSVIKQIVWTKSLYFES